MKSIFHIEVLQPTRPIRYYYHFDHSSQSTDQTVDLISRKCTSRTIATCWEILIAVPCSTLCRAFIIRAEERANNGIGPTFHLQAADEGHFLWISDPPPALMLGACLALGCAVSSFVYRRHEIDRFQTPIFILVLATALLSGIKLGLGANFIMLGLIPAAMCGAMVLSVLVHAFGMRCCKRPKSVVLHYRQGEKGELLGQV